MEPITFKVGRKEFTVDVGDEFMDNGACIQFLPVNRSKLPVKRKGLFTWTVMIRLKPKDWSRIKPLLQSVPHNWGAGVTIYKLKIVSQ